MGLTVHCAGGIKKQKIINKKGMGQQTKSSSLQLQWTALKCKASAQFDKNIEDVWIENTFACIW